MSILPPMLTPQAASAALLAQGAKPAEIAKLAEKVELFSFTKIFIAAVLIITGVLTSRVVRNGLDRLGEGNARRRLLMKKITSFVRLAIFALTAYMVIMTFLDAEDDKTALLGLGGTLAVALGFALKDVSSSLMAGILILFDQPFQVGDRVQFGETYGEVTEIGLRTVRIVTLEDNEVSIPNNKFLTEVVASANSGNLDMMVCMDFYISITEDYDLAKRIIYEACTTSRYVYLEKPVQVLVTEEVQNVAFCTKLRCKAYVIDTRYEKNFVTDVTERVKRSFRKHRIKYPYHREYQVGDPDRDEYEDTERNRTAKLSTPDTNTPRLGY